MKYDDASWHYGEDFPADLSGDAGATHIGMFLAWCLLNGLAGKLHNRGVSKLKSRLITPGQFALTMCDGKFTDEDLNEEGNSFAYVYYYLDENDSPFTYNFVHDYINAVDTEDIHDDVYHFEDSWDTFDRVAPLVERAFEKWKARPPVVVSPAERFTTLCVEVAESLASLGYKWTKSDRSAKRRTGGFTFGIGFVDRNGYELAGVSFRVASRKLKSWRTERGILYPDDTVYWSSLDDQWEVDQRGAAQKIATTLREQVHPYFELFLDLDTFLTNVAQLPDWEVFHLVEFTMCFGSHEQAREAAIAYFQNHMALYYDYISHFLSYRGESLENVYGTHPAKYLAHASHFFKFGDLSKEVTIDCTFGKPGYIMQPMS